MTATLIVSLSGLTESTLAAGVEFATTLDTRLVPVSWLLPPRPQEGRHHPNDPVIRWLSCRIHTGDALVLHGFDHTVEPLGRRTSTALTRVGRRAEFAALPRHEASLRLTAACRAMEELGLPSDVFAPPRWIASAGTLDALRRHGFRICADSTGVRLLDRPPAQEVILRGRVLSARGPSGPPEAWRLRALVAAAARTARRGGLVRITASAEELGRTTIRHALLDAIDASLAAGALPATYRRPVPAPASLSA